MVAAIDVCCRRRSGGGWGRPILGPTGVGGLGRGRWGSSWSTVSVRGVGKPVRVRRGPRHCDRRADPEMPLGPGLGRRGERRPGSQETGHAVVHERDGEQRWPQWCSKDDDPSSDKEEDWYLGVGVAK